MNHPLKLVLFLLIFVLFTSGSVPGSLHTDSGDYAQQLRLRVLLEDYYDPARAHMRTMMQQEDGKWHSRYGEGIADLVDVYLYETADARAPVYRDELPLSVDGWIQWDLPASLRGSYYVGVGHKLHETLVSASPIRFGGSGSQEWDFTTSASRSQETTSVALPVEASGDPIKYAAGSFSRRSGEPPPPPGGATLNVRVFLQGYYGHNLTSQDDKLIQARELDDGDIVPRWMHPISDRVTISMHQVGNYGNVLHYQETFLMTNGWARITFPSNIDEVVWISVRHRNHLETVYFETRDYTSFFTESTSIDFTTAASQAYGSNQASLDGGAAFGIFAGDVNQDGFIDGLDLTPVINLGRAFAEGYLDADLTGNGFIDGLDLTPVINNGRAFVEKQIP